MGYQKFLTWIDNIGQAVTAAFLNKIEQALFDLKRSTFKVEDYGAVGDASTDNAAAIAAAYADYLASARGGTIEFGQGNYRFSGSLNLNPTNALPLRIKGQGTAVTVLAPTGTTGDAINIQGSGNSKVTLSQFSIETTSSRAQSSYVVTMALCQKARVVDVVAELPLGGGIFQFDQVTFLRISDTFGRSQTANAGVALRIKADAGGAKVVNSRFETASGASGYTGCKPALHVTGTITSMGFSNCNFVGAGPHSQFTVTGITSTGANFTVTTSAAHDLQVGDFVVLRGMTPIAYNSQWYVATVPTSQTLTVTSTLNPGASSVNGTAESVTAGALITNEATSGVLSVNESSFSGCTFEASQAGLYGSAGLYFDGRRGVYPLLGGQSGSLSGWTLTGNYYDQYATGLLISGKESNSANETTANGFSIAGGVFNARGRAIHIDRAQAVVGSAIVSCVPGAVTPIDDGVSVSAGLYIFAGLAAPFTQGVIFTDCLFGMGRNMQTINNTPYKNGILLDGVGMEDVILTDNFCFGSSAGIGEINSPFTGGGHRFKIENNHVASGTFPPTSATLTPAIASAATISLVNNPNELIRITGSTTITQINNTYHGRKISLLFVSACVLGSGGNILATPKNVAAGEVVRLVYDANVGAWYTSPTQPTTNDQLKLTGSGVITETESPANHTTGVAPTSQQVAGRLIGLRAGQVVTGIVLRNIVAAAGTLPTTVRFGLADNTGKILVLSNNLNALASWGQGPLQFPFTAPFTVPVDADYFPVFVVNGTWGTTQPTPARLGATQWSINPLPGARPLAIAPAGLTDLPAINSSLTLTASTNVIYYMGVY
jgi:hypothetical protein